MEFRICSYVFGSCKDKKYKKMLYDAGKKEKEKAKKKKKKEEDRLNNDIT